MTKTTEKKDNSKGRSAKQAKPAKPVRPETLEEVSEWMDRLDKDAINMHFPPQTAGRLMDDNVPTVSAHQKVGEVLDLLRKRAKDYLTIDYIYVLDRRGKLLGVFSIRELLVSSADQSVGEIMTKDLVSARAHSDQERVALLSLQKNIKTIPIVDKEDRFLGIIPPDTIISVLDSEAVEDALKGAGVVGDVEKLAGAGIFANVEKRVPWLVIGLMGGLIAALVVREFEESLSQEVLLAAFIPTIVYMADAVGTQTQVVLIRYMAIERNFKLQSYLYKELAIGIIIGLIISVFSLGVALLWTGSVHVAIILSLALFVTIICAGLIGMILPWLFSKLELDPAIASGPFATIIRDLLSLLIYLSVAQLVLGG